MALGKANLSRKSTVDETGAHLQPKIVQIYTDDTTCRAYIQRSSLSDVTNSKQAGNFGGKYGMR